MTQSFSIFLLSLFHVCVSETKIADSVASFNDWIDFHGITYDTLAEHELRSKVWSKSQLLVQAHNQAYQAGHTTYAMSIYSPFAAMSDEEFASKYLMQGQNCSATTHPSSGRLRPTMSSNDKSKKIPSMDWRTKGIITPVKNQGHCGSCWTFSTTGCLEAHTCLAGHKKDCTHWEGLAEQQLIDCADDFNNFGCSGGLPSQAFEYIKYADGIDSESAYHYNANETGKCLSKKDGVGAKVAEVFNITSRDEDDLVHAVATVGPVSIAYQVYSDFRLYSHGVYDSFNVTTNSTGCKDGSMDVNHAVVAVGLGETEEGTPFYIVRNSWGTSWGMEGYFWMKRGMNLCGVSDCASFPLVPTVTEWESSTIEEPTIPMLRGANS